MAKVLTSIGVEKARAVNRSRTEIPDGGCRGLYLVVQPTGGKSWAFRYRLNGKPAKLTLGPVLISDSEPGVDPTLGEPHTLAQARKQAAAVAHRVAKREDPAGELRSAKAAQPDAVDRDLFETVAADFVERYAKANTRESTAKETERLLTKHVVPKWRGRRIQDIQRRDVIDLLDGLVDAGTPFQANRCLAAVRRLFNWALERDVVKASPCANVKAPAPEESRDRVLTDPELLAVWKAAEGLAWPFGDFTRLLILTGQRRDEVGGMRWSELDLEKGLWTLPRERVKNDTAHELPLSTQAVAILKAAPKLAGKPDYVFTTGSGREEVKEGQPTPLVPISGFSRAKLGLDAAVLAMARAEVEEGGGDPDKVEPIPAWRFHDLRRTVASGLARLGISLPVIEKVLNHKSGSFAGIVGVYQRHGYAEEKRSALQAWGNYVGSLGERLASPNVIPIAKGKAGVAAGA